jgi:thymidylate synthase ThyX
MTQSFEEFTPAQEAILEKFVTNTKDSVFALYNLPEVIKGALFSRYSRSTFGLRSLLLREFVLNDEAANFGEITGFGTQSPHQDQLLAIQKAQSFYDRILDGYGDDSIGELGGAHLAVENISMLAAKAIEDCRIGGSPLEKSTRYIYFDQKVRNEYLFHKEAVLMTSAWRNLYLDTCNMLFDTYSRLIPALTTYMTNKYPREAEASKNAYTAAIRAKVLDCVRGLLPSSTLTNVGTFGNGRFYEGLLHKLQCHNLTELQEVGKRAYDELVKVLPSFVRRADVHHKTHVGYAQFQEQMRAEQHAIAKLVSSSSYKERESYVKLAASDDDAIIKVAAALLYQDTHASFEDLLKYCRSLSEEDLGRILEAASSFREIRRHKSPRALENAVYTFEFLLDFGAYRDLQRHRILTQERQLLTCAHGYYTPQELVESGLEPEYRAAMEAAKNAYDIIAKDFIEEAQYVVPMAFRIRWYGTVNLRALQWITELRSQAAGHPSYRWAAQQMAKRVIEIHPQFERFFRFVDYDGHDIGRLQQEVRSEKNRQESQS